MKRPQDYLTNNVVSSVYDINILISVSKRNQVKSKEQKRLDNSLSNLIKELKNFPETLKL